VRREILTIPCFRKDKYRKEKKMKKLLLLSVMLSLACTVFAQNEPFCQSYIVRVGTDAADVNAVAVPENKEFVLLKLYVDCADGLWQINVDNEMWLTGNHIDNKNFVSSSREFPEGSAVVESGKNIILKKHTGGQYIYFTLIGYFRDAGPVSSADLNGDKEVNLLDLAILASQWMK
jgi:hypothetical protein